MFPAAVLAAALLGTPRLCRWAPDVPSDAEPLFDLERSAFGPPKGRCEVAAVARAAGRSQPSGADGATHDCGRGGNEPERLIES